jgi:hypothetical protein
VQEDPVVPAAPVARAGPGVPAAPVPEVGPAVLGALEAPVVRAAPAAPVVPVVLAGARRALVCLGVGGLATVGSINVGSFPAAAVVGLVLAVIAWIVWGTLDAGEDEASE